MIEKVVLNGEEHKLSPDYKDVRNKPSINGVELKDGDNKIEIIDINIDPDVDIVEEGETPSVTNIGTPKSPTLKFSLPKGDKGDEGPTGNTGNPGPQGPKGENAVNTFKGLFINSIPSTIEGSEGAFAYVYNTNDEEIIIYKYNGSSWESTNIPVTPSDNNIFKSGQSLPNISIVNIDNVESDDESCNILQAEDIIDELTTEEASTKTITSFSTVAGYIRTTDSKIDSNTNYTYHSTSKRRRCLLNVKKYDKIKITANSSLYCEYSFLKNNSVNSNKTPNYATGYEGTSVIKINASSNTSDITIPDDAVYLYLFAGEAGEYLPASVELKQISTKYLKDNVNALEDSQESLTNDLNNILSVIDEESIEIIKKQLDGVPYSDETKLQINFETNVFDGFIACRTTNSYEKDTYNYSTSTRILFIPLNDVEGESLRFLGLKATTTYATGYGFINSNNISNDIVVGSASNPKDVSEYIIKSYTWPTASSAATTIITVPIPRGATYFFTILNSSITQSKFYCYSLKSASILNLIQFKMPLSLNNVRKAARRIKSDNSIQNTTSYGHCFVDVSNYANNAIEITANSSGAVIAFLTDALTGTTVPSPVPWVPGYSGLIEFAGDETKQLTIPNGTKYLYWYYGEGNGSASATNPNYTLNQNSIDYTPSNFYIIKDFSHVDEYLNTKSGILDLYPEKEIVPKLLALRKSRGGDGTDKQRPNALIFGHITDCHGDNETITTDGGETWRRFIEFCDNYRSLNESPCIVDVVNTGDNGLKFVTPHTWMTDENKVLFTPGNHDTRGDSGNNIGWRYYANSESLYNKYVKDNIESWGVTMPTGHGENDYYPCYYYKDYSKTYNDYTQKLRAIFVDIMSWDNTEAEWLTNLLEDSRTNGYTVVIFTHYCPVKTKPISCSYTCIFLEAQTEDFPYNGYHTQSTVGSKTIEGNTPQQLCKIVHDFQVAGGVFSCYVVGHRHMQGITQVYGNVTIDNTPINFDDGKYPQLVIHGSCGFVGLDTNQEFIRVKGTKTQDNFQLVAIDTLTKHIKVLKIGCEYNRYMQVGDTACLSFSPFNNFDENVLTYKSGDIVANHGRLWRFLNVEIDNEKTIWEKCDKVPYSRILSEAVRV